MYNPTVTELQIKNIMRRFRIFSEAQIFELLSRNEKSRAKISNAIRNLYDQGIIFFNKETRVWKAAKDIDINTDLLNIIWLMMENTNGASSELAIYQNAYVNEDVLAISYIKENRMYYIRYLLNPASAMGVRAFEEEVKSKGMQLDEYVRVLYVSEIADTFKALESELPHYNILMTPQGERPAFEILEDEEE